MGARGQVKIENILKSTEDDFYKTHVDSSPSYGEDIYNYTNQQGRVKAVTELIMDRPEFSRFDTIDNAILDCLTFYKTADSVKRY